MKAFKGMICAVILAAMLASALPAAAADMGDYLYTRCEGLSRGQENIMKRARQLLEIEWTPVEDVTQWGGSDVFAAGTRYTGVPYGQPVKACYIGYDCTLSGFAAAVENDQSLFYREYSEFNKIAPYYSIDCSGFVSYAWGLPVRKTTETLTSVTEKLENAGINELEVGDCLNDTYSHAALVGGIIRDDSGCVVAVEILEQTPNIARHTVFGEGGEYTLDYFESYYFGGGYEIYRYEGRESVEYTHECAVPIDGDYCDGCTDPAPTAEVTQEGTARRVSLSAAEGCTIYYTVDGGDPAACGLAYEGPFLLDKSTEVRAIAVSGRFKSSRVLKLAVRIEQAEAPVCIIGGAEKTVCEVAPGSTAELGCKTAGAAIYYTTDGSDPVLHGQIYTSPLTINGSMTIRAVAKAPGYLDSGETQIVLTAAEVKAALFDDVSADSWYRDAVGFVCARGLFNGTGSGTFSPDAVMTRGMFITTLGRMAGVTAAAGETLGLVAGDDVNIRTGAHTQYPAVGTAMRGDIVRITGSENGWYAVKLGSVSGYIRADFVEAGDVFTDVDSGAYYAGYAQWAYLAGITTGVGDGKFAPEESITRRDMAAMLYNYSKSAGKLLPVNRERVSFHDESLMGGCRDAIYALQQAGVINGMSDGGFDPMGSATRAQVAQIYMNYMQAVGW